MIVLTVNHLTRLMLYKRAFTSKYRLFEPSFEMLVLMIGVWSESSAGMNVQSLRTRLNATSFSIVHDKLRILIAKGLVEVVEQRKRSFYYAPTRLALREFSEICAGL